LNDSPIKRFAAAAAAVILRNALPNWHGGLPDLWFLWLFLASYAIRTLPRKPLFDSKMA